MTDERGIGDNSGAALTKTAQDKLKQVIAKVERLEEDKKAVADDIKDVYAEAKSMGYDTATLKRIVRVRKQDKQTREEQQAIFDVYALAIGLDAEFYD